MILQMQRIPMRTTGNCEHLLLHHLSHRPGFLPSVYHRAPLLHSMALAGGASFLQLQSSFHSASLFLQFCNFFSARTRINGDFMVIDGNYRYKMLLKRRIC